MISEPLVTIAVATRGSRRRARRIVSAGTFVALLGAVGLGFGHIGVGQMILMATVVGLVTRAIARNPATGGERQAGPGTYERKAESARVVTASGEEIDLSDGEVASVELERRDRLIVVKRDGEHISLGSHDAALLTRVALDLGRSPVVIYRLKLLSPGDRSSSIKRIGAALLLCFSAVLGAAELAADVVGVAKFLRSPAQARLDVTAFMAFTTVASLAVAVTMLWYLRRKNLVVGADGIRYGFVRKHFIPYVKVTDAHLDEKGVQVFTDDGRAITLPVVFQGPDDAAQALLERIENARAAIGKSDVGTRNLARLDRGARGKDEWKAALEALSTDEGSYRALGFEPEALTRIAEDAGEAPERRVAAVIAARKASSKEDRLRIRAATAGCIDEDMKAALEAAAQGEIDDEAIDRATAKRSLVEPPKPD